MPATALKIAENRTPNPPGNSSLTVANLIDELDWVLGGYGNPTPQFLNSLNTFVEAYVLTDSICISLSDHTHLNLASPAFPNGRPLLRMLTTDGVLVAGGGAHIKGYGTVLFKCSVPQDNGLSPYHDWFEQYQSDVDRDAIARVVPNYAIGSFPDTISLLIVVGGNQSGECIVIRLDRDIQFFIRSMLTLSSCSRLHPAFPLYAAKAQAEFLCQPSHSLRLYNELAAIHGVNVEKLLECTGWREIPIPPLTSILLSRCKERADVPAQLRKLRLEFEDLRQAGRSHEERLDNARTAGEQIDAIQEFEEFWQVFAKRTKHTTTRLFYRVWDIVKEANPFRCFTKTVDNLVAWDQERFILNRFKGLMDIWRLTRNTPPVQNQLRDVERVFGSPIDSNQWRKYVQFAEEVNRIAFPDGRSHKD